MKLSPAPTVSTTVTWGDGQSTVRPSKKAAAPAPPRVSTTSRGPAVAQAAATAFGSWLGWSQSMSSSLALTTVAARTRASTSARVSSCGPTTRGRMLGS